MLFSTSTERLEERGQGTVQPLGEIPKLLLWYGTGFKKKQNSSRIVYCGK